MRNLTILLTTLFLLIAGVSQAQYVINGPSNACAGQTHTYNVETTGGGIPSGLFSWKINGALIRGYGISKSITFPTSGTNYTIEATGNGVTTTKIVTNNGLADPGSVSLTSGICGGILTIDASGYNGSVKWQVKVGSGIFTDYGLGFTEPLGYSVSAGTQYQFRVRTNTSCATQYSNTVTVTPLAPTNAGSINGNQTICSSDTPGNINVQAAASGGNGSYSHQWKRKIGSGSWQNITGNYGQLTSAQIGSLTQTTQFKRTITDGVCGSDDSNIVTVTVNPRPSAPSTPSVSSNTCGTKTITRGSPPGGITWYWQGTNSNGYSTSNSNTNYSVTSSGTYYIRARNNSSGCWSSSSTGVSVTYNPIPGVPSTPSVSTNTCEAKTLTRGNPPSGITWYWQGTNSVGTTTTNSSATYSASLGGTNTYYIRARNNSTGCWSSSRAVAATVNLLPSTPNTPSVTTNTCGPKTISTGTVPGGVTWYWQGTNSSGTSTSDSNNHYLVSSSGTYYLRARNNSSLCWSASSASVAVTVNQIPAVPTTPTVSTNVCGDKILTRGNPTSGITWYWQGTNQLGTSTADSGPTYTAGLTGTNTYYIRAQNNSTGCWSASTPVATTVTPITVGGQLNDTIEGDTVHAFAFSSGLLELENEVGSIITWQYRTTSGWNPILGTSGQDSYNYTNVTEPTYYRVEVQSGSCAIEHSNEVFVNVVEMPEVSFGISENIRPGFGTTISADPIYHSYQWYKNDVPIPSSNSHELAVTEPGLYKVTVTIGSVSETTGNATIGSQLEEDRNMVVTYDFRNPNYTSSVEVFTLDKDDVSISADIIDGLGRLQQKISLESSPLGYDMVAPVEYDEYGRAVRNYLPYVDTDKTVLYKADALTAVYANSDQYGFHNTLKGTTVPFSETKLEASPLNRVIEQGASGEGWQLGENTVTIDYDFNSTGDVIEWDYDALMTMSADKYLPNTLSKTTTSDEDGNQMIEFQNNSGQTILKKAQVNTTDWAETYYIYDDYGQLRVVLPPEASDRLNTEFFGATTQDKTEFLERWAFQYDYNERNLMISKKVPGADIVLMVYDQWDRLVLTQDGNQREVIAPETTPEWLFTKYDALNRPIMTGIMESSSSEATIRSAVASASVRYDTHNAAVTNQYSNASYPTTGITNYLTVTYYDSYAFQSHMDWTNAGLGFTNPIGLTQNTAVKGQVTGTMTKVADGSWIRSVSYYDDRYRPIQSQSTNHLGGKDVVTNYYDFIGQVTRTISSHNDGSETTTIERDFVYDHAGRLLETYHSLTEDVQWTDLDGLSLSGSVLTKTTSSGWGSGGAASVQMIEAGKDGWMEFTVESHEVLMIGLSEINEDAHFNTIDYAIYMTSSLPAYESGVFIGPTVGYLIGDVIRIGRSGQNIYFEKNGATIYTSSSSFSGPLKVDLAINTNGDQIGRVKIGKETKTVENYYNELGELIEKDLHGETGGAFAQSLDYDYNVRGWLTAINDAALTSTGDTNTDLFGMELLYKTVDSNLSNTALYNGNISAMKWSDYDAGGENIDTRAFTYGYDKLNRLTTANHFEDNASTNKYGVSGLTYDLNGNIEALKRRSTSTTAYMDDLAYDYVGNQLQYVNDLSSDSLGFDNNGTGTSLDYTYDANGNMVKDENKEIETIYYNHLNLPVLVDFETSGDSIAYLYDAAGIKLQQKVWEDDTLRKTTDYVGEFIYEDGLLQLIQHEEGRIVVKNDLESSTCIDCAIVKTELDDYVVTNGSTALLNKSLRTSYLNTELSKSMTEAEWSEVIDRCDLVSTYLDFNGSGYVDFGNQTQYHVGTGDFTIEAWIKLPSNIGVSHQAIFSNQNNDGSNLNGFNLTTGGGNLAFYVGDGLAFIDIQATLPSTEEWHHVVAQRVGNQKDDFKMFIDGVETSTTKNGFLSHGIVENDGVETLKVGSRTGSHSDNYFTGDVDEVRFYKRLLSVEEIESSYNGGCGNSPINVSELVFWADLNEGTGTNVTEKSTYSQLGTFTGTNITWSAAVNGTCSSTQIVNCEKINDYQYHLKDHLGNSRVTFSTTPENYTMTETFETGEDNGFQDLHRHTNANANTTAGGNEVERLQSGETGAMIFLSLNKGDTVDLNVQANYESAPSGNTFLQTGYNALFTAFDNVYGGAEGVTSAATDFNDAISGTDMAGKSNTSTAPRAFLNYIIFDKDMNYEKAGFEQISTSASGVGVHENVVINDIIAELDGYLLAYLSNENSEAVDVHFDDFTVYHGKTNVVQSDDYYPFGLAFNSYSRTASTVNSFLLTGNEKLEEWGVGVYDFNARTYDASIGRFFAIDPMAEVNQESWTPYHFNFNNPLRFVDPNGMYSTDEWKRDNGITDDDLEVVYQSSDGGNGDGQGDKDKKKEPGFWETAIVGFGEIFEANVDFFSKYFGSGLEEDATMIEKVDDLVQIYAAGKLFTMVRIPGVKRKVKEIKKGGDVVAKSFKEADQILFGAFPNAKKTTGAGPRNASKTSALQKSFRKNSQGSYHMDYKRDENGIIYGHEGLPQGHSHRTTPHINYMTPEGKKGTIYIVPDGT